MKKPPLVSGVPDQRRFFPLAHLPYKSFRRLGEAKGSMFFGARLNRAKRTSRRGATRVTSKKEPRQYQPLNTQRRPGHVPEYLRTKQRALEGRATGLFSFTGEALEQGKSQRGEQRVRASGRGSGATKKNWADF